ncbi:hypothetical protein GOP47_0024730 [Adiantum capillus-veneris]|uniref:Homeobox domain-containing protein n=1 Tax=Adiantum capillus-veneris TaxID=13818 RepID=A0A9D4Z3W7_ADICA|nr:hypothetical protein GOP47_0024730 [Adiantum capillus-veneris]
MEQGFAYSWFDPITAFLASTPPSFGSYHSRLPIVPCANSCIPRFVDQLLCKAIVLNKDLALETKPPGTALPPKVGGHSSTLMKKSSNLNIPTVPEGSPPIMTTIGIEPGTPRSTNHHMQFSGGISSYGSLLSPPDAPAHWITASNQYQIGSGAAPAPLGRSSDHYQVQHQQATASTASAVRLVYNQHGAEAAADLPAGLSNHYDYHYRHPHDHHHLHHPHSQQLLQQDLQYKGSISASVFNLHVHAGTGRTESSVDQQQYAVDHHGPYYQNVGSGRASKRNKLLAHMGKQEEEEDDEDDDGDEEEEEEDEMEEGLQRSLQEPQSRQNHVEMVQRAPTCNKEAGGGSSYGEFASTSSDGMSMMTMTMMNMKKRRLTQEQVRSLEVCFERESKLEPERKNELALELGLQPRQVAVWFQNRRARFKTKQLERDFDLLKLQYDVVRTEKDKLQAQVARLKDLLDAKRATSKKSTPSTSSEKQELDYDIGMKHTNPQTQNVLETMDGIIDIKATMEVGGAKHVEVFSSNNSDPTHVHVLEAPNSSSKGPITLEVKPSLQVPHIHHHSHISGQHQPPHFSNTFSPPTKLSLCSPQQFFLHQMVSLRMEGDNFNPSYHESLHDLYNEGHSNFNCLNENGEDDYKSDSMISSDSAWHHDP